MKSCQLENLRWSGQISPDKRACGHSRGATWRICQLGFRRAGRLQAALWERTPLLK
jgi:hypothetical protein